MAPGNYERQEAENVKRMAALYRARIAKYGERFVRDDLSAAREVAIGDLGYGTPQENLRFYQMVEKSLFGNLGPLNKNEKDLTVEGEQGATQ